jgi:soluble lytic murein transglycosylase-like protein
VEVLVRAEEIEATIKRLIKSEEGILAAIQLVDQMVQAGGIDERAEERLRGVIERRRIRFAVENSLDGGAFDSSGMSYEDVIASTEDLVEEFETPKEKEWAQTVTAMLGSDKAAGKIKDGGGVARREGQVITTPRGEDMGIAVQTNGKRIEPIWLMDGEFIISAPAVEGFGLRAGAAPEDAHAAGIKALNKLHAEHRNFSLNQTVPEAKQPGAPQTGEEPIRAIRQEKGAAPEISPADLIAEAQVIDERRERAAVTDGTGRWRASDELINAVIAAESGGDPNAVSEAGAIGLMQILPSTAADPGYGVSALSGSKQEIIGQLLDPETNKRLGTSYLNAMLNRYGGNTELALAAYNAGPGKADKVADSEEPLASFAAAFSQEAEETIPYVDRVLGNV